MIGLLVSSLRLCPGAICEVWHRAPTEDRRCGKLCGMCLMAMHFSADASTYLTIAEFLLFLAVHVGFD